LHQRLNHAARLGRALGQGRPKIRCTFGKLGGDLPFIEGGVARQFDPPLVLSFERGSSLLFLTQRREEGGGRRPA